MTASVKASVDDMVSRKVKKLLRSSAYSSGIVDTNLLFKSGYGYYVTLLCQFCFLGTFFYQTVINTRDNQTRKYLSPVGQVNSGANCTVDPIEITGSYTMDQKGYWDISKNFNYSQGIYNLDLKDVKFIEGTSGYQAQIQSFQENFKAMSDKSHERDFAWNMVFAASYSDTSFENNGVSQFRLNADARIMYKPTGETQYAGVTSVDGICNIDNVKYGYDDVAGAFRIESSAAGDDHGYRACNGIFSDVTDLSQDIEIDAATVSTALAVNLGITSLSSLSKLYVDADDFASGIYGDDDVSDYYSYFDVYIDSFYAPMQPIFCLKVDLWLSHGNGTESEWDSTKDNLCLVQFGTTFALPLTNHIGTSKFDHTPYYLDDEWFCTGIGFEQCTVHTAASAKSFCSAKDVLVSLLFFPVGNLYGYTGYDDAFRFMIDLVIEARTIDPEQPDLALMTLTYPAMLASYIAMEFADEAMCANKTSAILEDVFTDLCAGECSLLTFESNSYIGFSLNSGGYPYENLAFNNTLYDADLFVKFQKSPVQLTEKYQECHDTFTTAFVSAISNAFASAGLYTSLLLIALLTLIVQGHNFFYPSSALRSSDEVEATVRNSIARALEILASNGKMDDVDSEELQELLRNIVLEERFITDTSKVHNCESVGDIERKVPGVLSIDVDPSAATVRPATVVSV